MGRRVLKAACSRVLLAVGTVFGISILVFFLSHLIPGDPVDVLLGERAMSTDRVNLERSLGLDVPLRQQLVRYYSGLLHLDLGVSIQTRQPIRTLLAERAPYTLALAVTALGFALLLALPLGLWGALYPGRAGDTCGLIFALLGGATPSFIIGPALIVIFSVWLGWCPIGGADAPDSIVLPAFTLSLGLAAILSRQLRGALLHVLREPYMRAASARGLRVAALLRRHALRNAAIPVLTVLGMQLGALLGGTVITETVFAWPGLGTLTVEAIEHRDYPLLQACVLLIATSYVIVNALTDWLLACCDPRVRGGQ